MGSAGKDRVRSCCVYIGVSLCVRSASFLPSFLPSDFERGTDVDPFSLSFISRTTRTFLPNFLPPRNRNAELTIQLTISANGKGGGEQKEKKWGREGGGGQYPYLS